ncbi:MAG: GMC family oxidoreductase [Propionivibrio sp.]|nr:GMC family oxidoreductase [Propionivibrio sp.]
MLSIEEIERKHWDYLVIGTGIGGATAGHALAKGGKNVLFLEKGRAPFLHTDALQGTYPESLFSYGEATSLRNAPLLARAGRCYEEIQDENRCFVPLMGCGVGGSSALYGMAMERFFPSDFEPRRHFPNGCASSLPEAWPLHYQDMAPYYEQAEKLYRVRGCRDALRPDDSELPPPPPLSPQNAELYAHFQKRGLNPYQLPLACESVLGCECCQGYLCARGCKNDAGRICLEPAMHEYRATLLDECEVFHLEATPERITEVACRWQQRTITLHADQIILAAGALNTPALLLRSTSVHWPRGLANTSGLVGRNLMRHCVDLYLVFPRKTGENRFKEIGLSDFYQSDSGKLGTLQSFGLLPPAKILVATMAKDIRDTAPWASPLFALARPLLPALLTSLFERGVLLAAIMEDLPYTDNRVVPGPPLRIEYKLHPDDLSRLQIFRTQLAKALKPYRFLSLRQAEKNTMLAHVCGTCRFGDDPTTSVLNPNNRAHGLTNLFVVDSSFFPSSGGTNPALTIAANALRVADYLLTPHTDKLNSQL